MTNRKLRPLGDRVVVRRHEAPTTTVGGIIVPHTVRKKTMYGEALAVGCLVTQVAAGQDIMFSKAAGVNYTLDGEEYLLLREENIIGVVLDDVSASEYDSRSSHCGF